MMKANQPIEAMPQDNDRIIEIAANLSEAIKRGVIELLQVGAPASLLGEVLDATGRLDRAAQYLETGCDEYISGQLTTMEADIDPAIAELRDDVAEILQILSPKSPR